MKLLEQLYKISSKSGMEDRIKSFMLDCFSDMPLTVETDEIGNLFITKGASRTSSAEAPAGVFAGAGA
jgi:putative aminopeptidase FrvX